MIASQSHYRGGLENGLVSKYALGERCLIEQVTTEVKSSSTNAQAYRTQRMLFQTGAILGAVLLQTTIAMCGGRKANPSIPFPVFNGLRIFKKF